MIKSNIDLTENHDFQDRPTLFLRDIDIDDYITRDVVSLAEYKAYKKYEQIFGKRTMTNMKYKVFFNQSEEEVCFHNNFPHCYRCGKEIRCPWNYKGSLCADCDYALSLEVDVFPWQRIEDSVVAFINRDAKEIFDLR